MPSRTIARMVTPTESRWLDYAWRVANCPPEHRAACERKGGATSAPGYEGNVLRWPGYLGRDWREYHGVLCVGAVHGTNWDDGDDAQARLTLESALWTWLERGRSPISDANYLEQVRVVFEWWMPLWTRWDDFAKVLGKLGDRVRDVAWTNLAKCRAPRSASSTTLAKLCQRLYPVADVVAAIRPVAVLSCTKAATEGGSIVSTWKAPSADPLVFTFHGLHGTDGSGRRIAEWSSEAARLIRECRESSRSLPRRRAP